MKPFSLVPVFKDYLWGGTKLKTRFNKRTDVSPLAESWELAAHPDGDCRIANGSFAGTPLSEFLRKFPESLGSGRACGGGLPVLIKLIDAREPLSVQVHPDDVYAMRTEGGAGKTEMWYVLDREPGAFLYCGFQRDVSREELTRRIADGTVTEVLHKAPVEPGDVFFMEAGTVHAIGAGILIAEIQQSSNTTYRVFDYGRRGPDGKERPLHIEKALDVARRGPACSVPPGSRPPVILPGSTLRRLARCAHFSVELLELSEHCEYRTDETSFLSLLCLEGSAKLAEGEWGFDIAKGDSVFVPARKGSVFLEGRGTFLLTTVPDGEL